MNSQVNKDFSMHCYTSSFLDIQHCQQTLSSRYNHTVQSALMVCIVHSPTKNNKILVY